MPDIVGYADRGSYSEDNVPDNLANYLKLYEQTVEAVKKGDTYATRDIAEAKYLRESGKSANVAVSPLLDGIKWNQREPFNNLCPIYDGVNNAATGCAATAMAQVMAYWQYPKQLMEDIPAYVTRSYGISMPSISKGEPYDWATCFLIIAMATMRSRLTLWQSLWLIVDLRLIWTMLVNREQ